MATVPTIRTTVENRPAAPVYQSAAGATPEIFGNAAGFEQLAKGLERAGQGLEKIGLQQLQDDNERALKQADVLFSTRLREISYGDGTAENAGYYAAKGDNAVAGYEPAKTAVEKARQDILAGIDNVRVRTMFGELSAKRIQQELDGFGRHVNQQRQVANAATSEARITSNINDATAAWNDPQALARAMSVINGENSSLGRQQGLGPEVVQAKIAADRDKLLSGVITSALAAQDYTTAQKLFDQHAGVLSGGAKAELTTKLRSQALDLAAQNLRDEAMAKFPGNMEAQLKYVRDNAKGKEEDEALQRVRQQWNDANNIRAEADRATSKAREDIRFENYLEDRAKAAVEYQNTIDERARKVRIRENLATAWRAIEAGGKVSEIDPSVKADIDGTTLASMERREIHLASGAPSKTDWAAYSKYNQMDDDQLRELDPGLVRTQLADAQFTTILKRITDAQQGRLDPKNPISIPARINATAREVTAGMDKDAAGRVSGQLMAAAEEELTRIREEKKRQPNDQEVQDTLNFLKDRVSLNRWNEFFAKDVRGIQVEIPKDVEKKMREEFAAKYPGQRLTRVMLLREYIARQQADRKGGR